MLDCPNPKYILSYVKASDIPKLSPIEVCLLGRSNVGKSTFINKITNRKKLAYTSSTPGKTLTLNLFQLNDQVQFVDVPGYGYARVGKNTRKKFGEMVNDYLLNRDHLCLVIMLIDFKVGPTKDDILMHEYLNHYGINHIIVCTKQHKIAKTKQASQFKKIQNQLDNFADLYSYDATDEQLTKNIKEVIENKIS